MRARDLEEPYAEEEKRDCLGERDGLQRETRQKHGQCWSFAGTSQVRNWTHLSLPAVPALLVELANNLDEPAPKELPVSRCDCSGDSLPS